MNAIFLKNVKETFFKDKITKEGASEKKKIATQLSFG